jgi:predicted AlkP superfamily phosphohydrolase/phosphomutase
VLLSGSTLRHVLVIGVDGVRFDLIGPDTTPCIWALGQAGFLAPVPVDEATPTWSGPCWATIATGTGVAGHGVTRQEDIAPLVLAGLGWSPGQG